MADRVESVSRGTGGFVCSISGSAAPVRRGCGCSQVHSSTRQALARGLHSFAPSAAHRRPRHADAQRDSPLRRRSRKRTAAIATTRTACARAPPPQGASAKEPVTICRDGPNGSGVALPTRHTRVPSRKRKAFSGRPWQIVTGSFADAPCGGGARAHGVW